MPSPEKLNRARASETKAELLIELANTKEATQSFLETALTIDEIYRMEYLLEIRDGLLWELETLQKTSDSC